MDRFPEPRFASSSLALVLAITACIHPASAEKAIPSPDRPVAFTTEVRIEVDAQGRVIDVQPDAKLPVLVSESLRETVSAWKFAPPLANGQPVGGVTFVRIGACAAPADGGVRVAFDYLNNGPSRVGPAAPQFPFSTFSDGAASKIEITYRVESDGAASLEKADIVEGKARSPRAFRDSVVEWLRASDFIPEQVAGRAVATRVSLPIEYTVARATPASVKAIKQRLQAQAVEQATCQAALGEIKKQDHAVALDSPFKFLRQG